MITDLRCRGNEVESEQFIINSKKDGNGDQGEGKWSLILEREQDDVETYGYLEVQNDKLFNPLRACCW